ncbi:MAG: adenylate cyclase [Tardiphaga sp.]|jgi:TolB-like protein/class 3 adenylate cyclase|nr:adenylate cyclase [Tardiphaga sp.]
MVQEQGRIGRRLSAIVAADVAGYSRLMGLDEAGTARTLREHRVASDALVAKHGGRIVKTTGDGLLLEFPSVVDAVECSVAVQVMMAERNDAVPQDRRMLYRIGINLCDILIEGDDILGDGVNIAVRLERIAAPGGICISASAYDQVRDKIAVEFADMGDQSLKNIARPVRAYALVRDGIISGPESGSTPGAASTPRLSIVVLPFANIGGDPEQDYFVDGMTESLTTDLSRIAGAFVIARNSAYSYKGKSPDVRQVGRDLNVRYVLEGSVQRSGKRLRVNVQLIDAETGIHLWAERFDKPVIDLFDMQDEIVATLANTLDAELMAAEARRAERSLSPDAMDLCFQGKAWMNRGISPEVTAQARGFFERALALDPGNIEALVGVAIVDVTFGPGFLADDRAARLASAEAAATKALSLAPNHATAHVLLGVVKIFTNRGSQGIAECERALALDRNLADAHAWIGIGKYSIGRAEETEAHIHEALRLSPRDIHAFRWMWILGLAKFQLQADAEAAAWMRQSLEANRNQPIGHFLHAAVLAQLGMHGEALASVQAGLVFDPGFTIKRFLAGEASDNPTYLAARARLCEGLRMAGVPEG